MLTPLPANAILNVWYSAVEDLTTVVASAGTHFDDPVGSADDVGVVFDDNDGIALVDKFSEHIEQNADVLEVQAGGGLVEYVERAPCIASGKFGSELHALALAARKGVAGLAKLDVTESDLLQHFYLVQDNGLIFKELDGLVDGHIEHIGYAFSTVAHFECLAVVTLAAALFAGYIDIGQEVHFDGAVAVAFAAFAAPALDIEGEASWLIAPDACLGQFDEEVADVGEDVCIGGWIGARGPSEGALIDVDYLVDVLQSLYGVVGQWICERAVEVLAEDGVECLADERALAAAADSCDADEFAQGNLDIDVLEVVAATALEGE